MQLSGLAVVVLGALAVASVARSQYVFEECHWECEVVHCDYYSDYCEYECHEICYPYARSMFGSNDNNNNNPKHRQQQVSSITQQAAAFASSHKSTPDLVGSTNGRVSSRLTMRNQVTKSVVQDSDKDIFLAASDTDRNIDVSSFGRANNNQPTRHHHHHHQQKYHSPRTPPAATTKSLDFESTSSSKSTPQTFSGKVVRMRIQNAPPTAVKSARKEPNLSATSARCMTPRSFAMFETCLSSRETGASDASPDGDTRFDPRLSTKVSSSTKGGHLVFGTPELSIRAKLH